MRSRSLVALGVAALVACAPAEEDVPVEEEVPVEEPAPSSGVFGNVAPASSGVPSIVTLTAGAGVELADRPSPLMDQLAVQFSPRFLTARPGELVSFKNSETIAHNVTVTRATDRTVVFDEDTPADSHVQHAFEEEGGYDVTCETHPGMRGFILVTPAHHAVYADMEGAYHIPDVPAGDYTLAVWSLDEGAKAEREITVPATGAIEVSTEENR